MAFELTDKSADAIRFNVDSDNEEEEEEASGVAYFGARSLAEYRLESERLELGRSQGSNRSLAVVHLLLRRRTQFHAVNAFAQTLVVLVAAVASFFFDLDDFSDRVVVCVVLLLVVATINSSSVQSAAPATAYFKLVDVWMLFCVVLLVLAIILHTILAVLFGLGGGGRDGAKDRRSAGGAFRRMRTNSGSLTGMKREVDDETKEDLAMAKIANYAALAFFLVVVVLFNIVFWVVAFREYNMNEEELLAEKKAPIR